MVQQSTQARMTRLVQAGLTGAADIDPIEDRRRKAAIADIRAGLKRLDEQREIAEKADDMYDGDVGVTYASAKVRRLLVKHGAEDIPDFNYARIPVDDIANRLKIAAVKVAPAEENTTPAASGSDATKDEQAESALVTRAEQLIARLRKSNELDQEEKSHHTNVSKHGQAFILVWPVTDDAGTVVDVEIRINTAHTVAMMYDDEDPLRAAYAIKSWTVDLDGKPVTRANLYYFGQTAGPGRKAVTGRIERWSTEPGATRDSDDSWKKLSLLVDLDDEENELEEIAADEFTDDAEQDQGDPEAEVDIGPDDIPNPWGQVWFHFRNGRPCGRPEHASAYGPQELINKLIVGHGATIDFQSFPQRYLMVDPAVFDPMSNLSDPDHPEDEDDDPETETGSSGLKSDPAAVWKLYGKSTGEYAAADPQVFLAPLDRYVKAMAELTDLAQYKFTKSTGDVPSGEALSILNGPSDAKVIDRQDRYDPPWEGVYELALKMLGITGVTVDIRWVPPSRVNDAAGWATLKAKVDMGIPTQVIMEEAGYAPELVEQWLANRAGGSWGQRMQELLVLAQAVQALGAGVTLGVVSETTTQALVERTMRALMADTHAPEPGEDGGDTLPAPQFREPPPVNPAMAAVEAGKEDPLRQAQVESTKASAETSRASAEMMRAGQAGAQGARTAKKTAPAKKVIPGKGPRRG